MPQNDRQTRRSFFRSIGSVPSLIRQSRRSKPDAKEPAGGKTPDQDKPRRRISKKQFSLHSIFYFVTFVCVLAAIFRDRIVADPLLVLGAFAFAIFLSLVEVACYSVFDGFLWSVFGDDNRKDR